MGMELRFRSERRVEVDEFDWLTPAEELGGPSDAVRALYEAQARHGALFRAAAKDLEPGDVIDPAEAQAR